MMHGVRILAAFLSSVSRRTIPPGGRLAPGTARPHWLPGRLRAAGAAAVLALALADAIGAQQAGPPVTQVPPARAAAWTPSADAPEGLLTPLEGQRHDRFIEQARAGGIDLVFFGSTETEMWLWRDRGRSVWDRAFGSLRAANFGTQGTRPASLLWRLQNGELDGYQARLVVLQALGTGDPGHEAAIVEEIRARQPQARILLVAPLPRSPADRASWRQRAAANAAAVGDLVDDENVFHVDIGGRFFRPDGSFDDDMWSSDLANRGRQTAAFEVWAQELQPWLDRFVR